MNWRTFGFSLTIIASCYSPASAQSVECLWNAPQLTVRVVNTTEMKFVCSSSCKMTSGDSLVGVVGCRAMRVPANGEARCTKDFMATPEHLKTSQMSLICQSQ